MSEDKYAPLRAIANEPYFGTEASERATVRNLVPDLLRERDDVVEFLQSLPCPSEVDCPYKSGCQGYLPDDTGGCSNCGTYHGCQCGGSGNAYSAFLRREKK